MKGVTSEVIAEVRSRAGILEVISETVVLKRAGKDYKGCCPFHGEKSPSFFVSPDKGIFKCFGCNEGGDVFAFIQKSKGLDFIDSVRDLAQKYGVQLAESVEDRKQYDKRSQILMLYQQASEYYIHLLQDPNEGAFARQYLQDRGMTAETIAKFKLGYAPNAWDGLLTYLSEKTKVSQATLEEAGLVRKRQESSGCYDLFRNRLMIPICDSDGKVIAFGGRTLGDDQVKYLNSPETPIYHKGLHLFGFNLAKDSIKKKDSVIVVEGYFDAITSHQFGFTNTVATLGTALTEQQAKQLVRYTDSKRVYLSFDADAAGVRAVDRGSEVLTQIAEGVGIELRVIAIPGGKDPDECLRSGAEGVEAFTHAIDKAALMLDYRLEKAIAGINVTSSMGRIEASRKVVPILAQISSAIARSEYLRIWALKLGIREEQWLTEVGEYRRANRLDQPAPGQGGGNRGYNNYNGGGGYNRGYNQYNQNQGGKFRGNNNFAGGNAYGGGGTRAAELRPSAAPDHDPFAEAAALDDPSMNGPAGDDDREIAMPVKPKPVAAPSPQGYQNQQGGYQSGPGGFPNQQQGGYQGGFNQGNKGNWQKGGGKGGFKKKEKDIADEESMPMPFYVQTRRAPMSGHVEGEKQLLALYLTSREDYDIAIRDLGEDRLITPAHRTIKQAVEGVGPNFATVEDLQNLVMDRIGADKEASKAMVDVIYKAEEFRKQKVPVQVVLKESRARILKERISLLITESLSRLSSEDESEVTRMQGRIKLLTEFNVKVLPNIETIEELEDLRRKLDAIEDDRVN